MLSIFFIVEGCILLCLLLQSLGAPSMAILFFRMQFFELLQPTTCFGPYWPSSGGIYTCQFLGAIYATTDPLFLSYQLYIQTTNKHAVALVRD
jgi:hypothetical protein